MRCRLLNAATAELLRRLHLKAALSFLAPESCAYAATF
jgi:hypothetical protein